MAKQQREEKRLGRLAPRSLRSVWCLCFTVLITVLSPTASAFGQNYQAEQVKAALLFKFAKLIGWSEEVQKRDRFTFGVLGDSSFAATLSALVEGKSISGREIEVLDFTRSEGVKPCHVLFLGEDFVPLIGALTKRLGPGVVSVGDGIETLNQGGVVAFLVKDDRFRFALSVRNARSNQVVLSRELQSLAETIVE